MKERNVPTGFSAVYNKDPISAKAARENFEMIMLNLFMNYVKANPDFFQHSEKNEVETTKKDKQTEKSKEIVVQLLTI